MATRIASAFTRLFDGSTGREQVHFHNHDGRAIACHDERCASPRLDLQDAPATRSFLR